MFKMQQFFTPAALATQIQMEMQAYKKTFLLVEGHDDANLFKKFVDEMHCRIVDSLGKRRATEAMRILDERGVSSIIAILDADYDRLCGVDFHERIILTDENDIELTIVSSSAFDDFLIEKTDAQKFYDQFGSDADRFRAFLYKKGAFIGAIRCSSARNSLEINFKNISWDFINKNTLEVNYDRLIENVIRTNNVSLANKGVKRTELLELIAGETRGSAESKLCRGHDVIKILGMALRSLIAQLGGERTSTTEIESDLRLAFSWRQFEMTDIYARLRDWEKENPPIIRSTNVGSARG